MRGGGARDHPLRRATPEADEGARARVGWVDKPVDPVEPAPDLVAGVPRVLEDRPDGGGLPAVCLAMWVPAPVVRRRARNALGVEATGDCPETSAVEPQLEDALD